MKKLRTHNLDNEVIFLAAYMPLKISVRLTDLLTDSTKYISLQFLSRQKRHRRTEPSYIQP